MHNPQISNNYGYLSFFPKRFSRLTAGVVLLAITFCVAHFALADGTEDIAIRSFNSTDDGMLSLKTQRLTLFILWVLVVGILTVGILSSSSRRSQDRLIKLGRSPDASNLFLGIKFAMSGDQATESGFIRSLGMRKATFVASRNLPKTSKLSLDFSSLPGFAANDHLVEATVVKSRAMAKDQMHFLVDIRFEAMSDSLKLSLGHYLNQLTASRHSSFQRV